MRYDNYSSTYYINVSYHNGMSLIISSARGNNYGPFDDPIDYMTNEQRLLKRAERTVVARRLAQAEQERKRVSDERSRRRVAPRAGASGADCRLSTYSAAMAMRQLKR